MIVCFFLLLLDCLRDYLKLGGSRFGIRSELKSCFYHGLELSIGANQPIT